MGKPALAAGPARKTARSAEVPQTNAHGLQGLRDMCCRDHI